MTPGAIMNHLVGKKIAVNAEVVLARRALVATADTHAFSVVLRYRPLVLGWYSWERQATGKAG